MTHKTDNLESQRFHQAAIAVRNVEMALGDLAKFAASTGDVEDIPNIGHATRYGQELPGGIPSEQAAQVTTIGNYSVSPIDREAS